MPNGKPGDHPLTDILNHGGSDYGDPVDSLVREMAAARGFAAVCEDVSDILWDNWPKWRDAVEGGREIAFEKLAAIKAQLTK